MMWRRRKGSATGAIAAFRIASSVGVILFLLASCTTPAVVFEVPQGFARYQEEGRQGAISPEGVLLSAYKTENEPEQSLEFWAEAVELQLTEAGYLLLGEGSFSAPEVEGRFFEWVAPLGDEDWVYLTAFCVDGDAIGVVEAAGPYETYDRYRRRIRESLETVKIR